MCTFTPYANWLLPGSLMLGRYPFIEPNRCPTREQGEAQLDTIIRAGVTTFYCLQAELAPQEELRLAGQNGFMPYYAPATLIAAALSDHPGLEEINGLRTPDLDKFLPPRRRKLSDPPRRRIELAFGHCPIVDLEVPIEDELAKSVAEMKERILKGECLYLHCWAGRGRAGTVGACLLAALHGLSADEALERVQRAFSTRNDEGFTSPQTDEQRAFVRKFIGERLGQ